MCVALNYGIGGKITGIVIGVVNDEVPKHSDCFNSSLKTFEIQRFDCNLFSTSCRFIKAFNQSVAKLVREKSNFQYFYHTFISSPTFFCRILI